MRKEFLVAAILVAIGALGSLIYFLLRPKKHLAAYQYIGANNCVTKVRPPKGTKGYDKQADCEKNEYVNNGWKMVTARGSQKTCFDDTGNRCTEGAQNCNCYQNKVCVVADGEKASDVPPVTSPCKIGDDDCFLTQYGCWSAQNTKKWKCTARGDGCQYVNCDPGDSSCHESKEECTKRCNAYCSENHGCIQTNRCVEDDDGNLVVRDPTGKPTTGDFCQDNIKDCAKKCKSVKCDYSKFSDPTDTTRRKACRWSLCAKGDNDCLDPKWKTDPLTGKLVFAPLQNCLLADCAPYKCTGVPDMQTCEIRDGGPYDRTGKLACDPSTDETCYLGVKACADKCPETKDSWICGGLGNCFPTPTEGRETACDGNSCYDSEAQCIANCATAGMKGYSCYDGCSSELKCPVAGFGGGLTAGGGGAVCFKDQKSCGEACGKMAYTVYDAQRRQCITLDKNRRCDLVKDSDTCFPNKVSCQTNYGLPYT